MESHSLKRIYSLSFRFIIICITFFCMFETDSVSCQHRIAFGNETVDGDWPFIAALFQVKTSEFFCGGTILSNRHVLTAAHCIQSKSSSEKLSPNDIAIRLGAYNLSDSTEHGVVNINVAEIFIHPEWKEMSPEYDADVAVLVLSHQINFTEFIQPVHLPSDNVVIDGPTIRVNGTIVGWGIAENKLHAPIPKQANVQAINDSHCYRTTQGIVSLASPRTFCAGFGDGAPTKGDSGGGFFVKNGTDWVQYGVISAITTNQGGQVDIKAFAVYANVQAFKKWIVNTTTTLDKLTLESNETSDDIEIDLICSYQLFWNNYTCLMRNFTIENDNLRVASIIGSHDTVKTNQNVNIIKIEKGKMFSLPKGIGKFFRNLLVLTVRRSVGLKIIKRSNLQNFENLKLLNIYENEVETLDEDTLWDLPSLETFQLIKNKLTFIHEKTFEKNLKLKIVTFHSNQLESLPTNLFHNNRGLERIDFGGNSLKTIEIDFTTLAHAKTLIFNKNVCIDIKLYTSSRRINAELKHFQHLIDVNCRNIQEL